MFALSKVVTSLGLMSGTSLDGIDVALLRTDGAQVVERGPSATLAYDSGQRALLRRALADAVAMDLRQARPGCLAEAEIKLTRWHAEAVHAFCHEMGVSISNIDVIGFHGQTVLHQPEKRLTVQLGDGQALADATGIDVVYDLRAADVAAGGQGAPLVPVYHRALAQGMAVRPVAFVNIGGVANMTWIGADGGLVAFDTGPGNALVNDWCESHGLGAMDTGGALAKVGAADARIIESCLQHPYFAARPPKSLDRNSFNTGAVAALSAADGARTLTAFTAAAIAQGARQVPHPIHTMVICGGGRHNVVMMDEIRSRLQSVNVLTAEECEFNGDSMEAEAWAFLAVRCQLGLPLTFPGTTGVARELTGGRMARPLRQAP